MNKPPGRRRGRNVGLSVARRMVVDYMWAAQGIPIVFVMRRCSIPAVIAARSTLPDRPAWPAIFAKAFAMVAAETPELRRVYLRWPWPHLHEYADSAVSIIQECQIDGDTGTMPLRFRRPETLALRQFSAMVRRAAEAPIEQSKFARRLVRLAGYPAFVRRPLLWLCLNIPRVRRNVFGTFGLSSVAPLQTTLGIPRSPLTCFLTYGPFDKDGSLEVWLSFDHRIFDGGLAGRVLARLEQVLNTSIVAELRDGAAAGHPPVAIRP